MTTVKEKTLQEKLISLGKGAAVAAIGAALTYAVDNLGEVDFGIYTPMVVALASVLVNAARQLGIPTKK